MIVADASWIIALRDDSDTFHDDAVAYAEETIAADIVLHEVTLAECLVGPARFGDAERAEADLQDAYTVEPTNDPTG